ncbi:hypothetical protein G9A89_015084 [Geosiphon pyriformis]|nr:hypothetical protein G9A89_015084 [Geosiphon pyriformis]
MSYPSFQKPADSKKIRCVVYLEPSADSRFYQSIDRFFAQTYKLFGPNEAHQYHPHVAMTGFFNLYNDYEDEPQIVNLDVDKNISGDNSDENIGNVKLSVNRPLLTAQEKLDVLVEEIDTFLGEHGQDITPPRVEGILLSTPESSTHYPSSAVSSRSSSRPASPALSCSSSGSSTASFTSLQSPLFQKREQYKIHRRSSSLSSESSRSSSSSDSLQSLLIPLEACQTLHDIATYISSIPKNDPRFQSSNKDLQTNIRKKSINHISLAYCGNRYASDEGVRERLTGEAMQNLLKMARDEIVFDEVKDNDPEDPMRAGWDLVVFENLKSCSTLEDRHAWREVKRWKIVDEV